MANLRFFGDNGSLQARNIGTGAFVLGRADTAHLTIVDDLVSREHARIERDGEGRYRMRHLSRRTNTVVNGQPITETVLNDGDIIRLGAQVFEFVDSGTVGELKDFPFLVADRTPPPETLWAKSKMPITLPLSRFGQLSILGAGSGYPPRVADVASTALAELILLTKADRGFVAMRGEGKTELHPVAQRGFLVESRTKPKVVSRAFVYTAFMQSSAGRYPNHSKNTDSEVEYAGAGLVAPLLDRNKVIGVVYVDRTEGGQLFPETALQEIAAAGAHMGALVSDASKRLLESESTVGDAWLAHLRRMQLSATIPPTDSKSFRIAARLVPGRLRCGDFLDAIHLNDERTILLMIDVGGQGVAGFVQAAAIRTALRSALRTGGGKPELGALFTAVNNTMLELKSRALVTCTVLDLDLSAGQVRYVNAGGPMPLLIPGPSRLVTLDQPSLVLGVEAEHQYEATSIAMPGAFHLICHTDGLIDMRNESGESFGAKQLHNILLEHAPLNTAQEFLTWIVGETAKHRGETNPDDDALICVVSHG